MKKIAALLMTTAMVMSFGFTAIAAEYNYIKDVSIDVVHQIEIDEYDSEVTVLVGDSRYEVESVKVTNEPDDVWEDGDKPKVTIELWVKDEEDDRFASGIGKSDIYLDDDDGKVTGVTRKESGKKLVIKIELPKLERDAAFYETALCIDDAVLDSANGVGYWEENEYAKRYEVRLYRNGAYIEGPFRTYNTKYDFSEYFTRKGEYSFRVRGLRTNDIVGEWYESEEIEVDSDEAREIRLYGGISGSNTGSSATGSSSNGPSNSTSNSSTSNGPSGSTGSNGPGKNAKQTEGTWLQNAIGWWWCNPDRTYPANVWKEINGAWYFFDQSGYCLMNSWIKSQDGTTWYYCGNTGAMATNAWVYSGGKYYYCGPDGAMWTSRRTPDGYYVDSNGEWIQ